MIYKALQSGLAAWITEIFEGTEQIRSGCSFGGATGWMDEAFALRAGGLT